MEEVGSHTVDEGQLQSVERQKAAQQRDREHLPVLATGKRGRSVIQKVNQMALKRDWWLYTQDKGRFSRVSSWRNGDPTSTLWVLGKRWLRQSNESVMDKISALSLLSQGVTSAILRECLLLKTGAPWRPKNKEQSQREGGQNTMQRTNETGSWFFEKVNKIYKTATKITTNEEGSKLTKLEMKKRDISLNTNEI